MTARTGHSFGGMRRYMQMSRVGVFIFVEGRDLDPDVYSRLCGPVCTDASRSYEIVIADRITGDGGGGKGLLVRLFEYLRDANALIDFTERQQKLAMFYLDKDADDVFRKLRISEHVVYTLYYSIENHLFSHGDLVSSIATAGSLDSQMIRGRIPNPTEWRAQSASWWQEWVALCLLARKLMLPRPVSYGLESTVNSPPDSLPDMNLVVGCEAAMQMASRLPAVVFQRKLGSARRLTRSVYSRAQHDLLFKGKWYAAFALRELEAASNGQPYNKSGASNRLIGSLVATLDFNGSWAEHFRGPLRAALSRFP